MSSQTPKPIWSKTTEPMRFAHLKENKKTDVLVIGGGIAGILCAYMLRENGVNCILVEADRICNGITKDTTAKITFSHGLLYDKLIKNFGINEAQLYLEAQMKACYEYASLCKKIPCDYEKKDSFVYSTNDRRKIENEVLSLNRLGVKADFFSDVPLPFKAAGAVRVKNQAQFNPLKFLYAIAKELPIYENTKVVELEQGKAKTEHNEIICKKIVVATHFPMLNKHGSYFLKMFQHRSYVLALEGAPYLNGMYVDEADKGLSFRNYKNLLLLGGGGHRTGKKGGCWQELEVFAKKNYKEAKIVAKWATQDCITLDGVPYVGQYSKRTPNLYVATGFNKWGITNSLVAANIICDLVSGKTNPYAAVFSPSRGILRPQLAVNAFESILGLITPFAPRCPHLGCALKYNTVEHTWDCSCHGSRFTQHGELIDNPATDDKKNMPLI